MSELSSETRALIHVARRARLPDPAALSAVERELREKLDRLESTPAPLPGRRTLALAIVAVVLAAASSVAAYGLVRAFTRSPATATSVEEAPAPTTQAPARRHGRPHAGAQAAPLPPSPSLPPLPPLPSLPTSPVATAPGAQPLVSQPGEGRPAPLLDDRPRVSRPGRAPEAVAVEPEPARPGPEADPALVEETRLLVAAQSALRDHEPGRALDYLSEHERRFPAGTLALEREAAGLVARCQLGRSEALRERAERFIALHPGSVHLARIHDACLVQ